MQFMDTLNNCNGKLFLEVRKNGKIIEVDNGSNLIVDVGRMKLVGVLGGKDVGKLIDRIGVGSGSSPADYGDKNLTQQVLIPLTSTEYDGKKVRFNFVIGNSDANGVVIREFGLFFNDGTLFSRRVRKSSIGKENDIELTGHWDIYL